MASQSPNSVTPQRDPASLNAEDIAQIAERLEANRYTTVFGGLEDWHLLRAAAFFLPNLVAPYAHLLEMEVDED
ncbi:MAG: DUF2555 domain-containing protein [Synechococcaceae cyanobacterium SM2_3_1]|nr:DUF2555 domain-containing protein [Synechococcaceae cyanobacterium SM2_3_1]